MNILAIHNKYLSPGGEDLSHIGEVTLLRSKGLSVYEYILDNKRINELGYTRTALRTVWSNESYRELDKIFKTNHFDLAIIQNFFPLISPSIFYAARINNVPSIQFLHNYRIPCVNAMFFRNNQVCTDCLGKAFPFNGIIHKCYKNSAAGSLSVGMMSFIHRMLGTWQNKVDGYICLTQFAKEIFIKAGLPKNKLFTRPNFIFPDPGPGGYKNNEFIFIGRISIEKGIKTLIKSSRIINNNIKIKIIGSGMLHQYLDGETNQNIEYLGQQSNSSTMDHLKKSYCLIFPSICYEGMPRTILEAFACGTPVIASDLGAMQEIVAHGKTGLLFRHGDPIDLAEKINWAYNHPDEISKMGQNARAEFESKYTAEIAYSSLMGIYEQISNRE